MIALLIQDKITMRTIIKLILLGSSLVLSNTVQSDEAASGINFSGDILSRTKLTGDWGASAMIWRQRA